MSSDIDWSKAPEGATHFGVDVNGVSNWYKDIGKHGYHYYSQMQCRWIYSSGSPVLNVRDIRNQVEWDGNGLPPVGTE